MVDVSPLDVDLVAFILTQHLRTVFAMRLANSFSVAALVADSRLQAHVPDHVLSKLCIAAPTLAHSPSE
eukprot:607309-Pyramimonas_sp.AAC.1